MAAQMTQVATSLDGAARPPKAAMLVAQRIIRDVISAQLKPGDLLLPERTMLERYQTGRGTLREALRLLEFQGVISLKPGPRGGPVLQRPSATHLASTLVLLLQLKEAPFRSIVEVRSAMADDQPPGGGADDRRGPRRAR